MNPGLPGTGIGGLFYIVSALWMPVCELWRWSRGRPTGRWPLVAKQFAIAVGVLAAVGGVFWVLESVFMLHEATRHVARAAGQVNVARTLHLPALVTTVGVLVALIAAVHLARLVLWLRGVRPTGP